jgi:hypothetical protein
MNLEQNTSILRIPLELAGVLVCDALTVRDGIVITGPHALVLAIA